MSRSASFPLTAVLLTLLGFTSVCTGANPRREINLDEGWRTALTDSVAEIADYTTPGFDDSAWRLVDVPHNWDAYEGARQVRHGNLHGSAWYRLTFAIAPDDLADGRRAILFFRGVGSYATVWVNGREVGRHAGGLTTFTLDVTEAVRASAPNTLVVRADHPAGIRDLPWVCGGCELVNGFSERPQPFGIFRSVNLIVTAPVRVEPFGIHVWNDADASAESATIHLRTEVRNHGATPREVQVVTRVQDRAHIVAEAATVVGLQPGETRIIAHDPPAITRPLLWDVKSPERYTVTAEIRSISSADATPVVLDRDETVLGIRSVRWPDPTGSADQPLLINGEPVFLNGTCDYEHNLGANHSFSWDQVCARASQIRAAGFNAFRDAHHPHDLAFNQQWDVYGLLWWTQFGAQIWFDREDFRANYKRLLRQWVKERRNSPSLILWGLQNESKLPTAFAEECAAIIREMDPTASTQRLITTCNGGTGTDWNVPQNWTGTYGGDPLTYAEDLRRQRLVGEYGAWRSLGLHSEGAANAPVSVDDLGRFAAFDHGPLSEERLNALLETKIRLAESVRGQVVGHFHWPFTTHANPGRNFGENGEQLFDGFRPLDRIGPANNKGLFTLWGEPTDAYHLYRSNYTDPRTNPMVAIMSRSWPDRWTEPGRKIGIIAYSNCEEVELFNDLGDRSLGVRTRAGAGTHFRWDDVPVEFNTLRAKARVGGKVVATDAILLHHLPDAPRYTAADAAEKDPLAPVAGSVYLHRINCGGPDYRDRNGDLWSADRGVSTSWASEYPHLPPEFGSQRRIYEPIAGTRDDPLFQSFRYGRDRLRYTMPVPNGAYEVDFFLVEPWYGAGGERDCHGWRNFDIAINGVTAVTGIDPWYQTRSHARAMKETAAVDVTDGRIEVSFRVNTGQAVISAIAVRTRLGSALPPVLPEPKQPTPNHTHLDLGDRVYADATTTLASLPPTLLESDLIRPSASGATIPAFTATHDTTVYVAHDTRVDRKPGWLSGWEHTGQHATTVGTDAARFELFRRFVPADSSVDFGANHGTEVIDPPASMYFVILEPARPLPSPQYVENLATTTADTWLAHGHVKTGHPHTVDGSPRFSAIPAVFGDGDWLLTPARPDGPMQATFTAPVPIEVAVGLDTRVTTPPDWLHDWIPTTWSITSTREDAPHLTVLRRRFASGELVRLGDRGLLADGRPAAPYAVLVRPVRTSATFPGETEPSGARWVITVQVGDRYGLNFRHRSDLAGVLRAPYSIIASDGAIVCSGALDLPASPSPETWHIARARTCASLNAGTYVLHVELPAAAGRVVFDTLEVE